MSKYQEALKHIGLCYVASEGKELEASEEYMGDYYTLRELVNKEEPIKPESIKQSYVNLNLDFKYIYFYKCAVCGNNIHFYDNYCSKCGQKIDWSDELKALRYDRKNR